MDVYYCKTRSCACKFSGIFFTFRKKWVGLAMGNETFFGGWPYKVNKPLSGLLVYWRIMLLAGRLPSKFHSRFSAKCLALTVFQHISCSKQATITGLFTKYIYTPYSMV